MGWHNIFHCEWNPFGQKVLKHHWPNAISYSDITKTDFSIHRGSIDILTGGFPCQPFSVAGAQLGTADSRHLWPEFLRAIKEIRPRFVVGENVRGLVSWNGGMVFDQVCADLETEGYEVFPALLPACGVNAPHRRDRIWFIASNANGGGGHERAAEHIQQEIPIIEIISDTGECGYAADAEDDRHNLKSWRGGIGQEWRLASPREPSGCQSKRGRQDDANPSSAGQQERNHPAFAAGAGYSTRRAIEDWTQWPAQSPICNGDDGFPARLDGIAFPKWRNESIKSGGNAIVPQVALQIFKAIEACENLSHE